MYTKDEIEIYNNIKYADTSKLEYSYYTELPYDNVQSIDFDNFREGYFTEVRYEDSYFSQLNVIKYGNRLLLEYVRLGGDDGYYKDWSYKKFMESFNEVCNLYSYVYVSNFDLSEDNPDFRAFFISMLINIEDYVDFNEVYEKCGNICKFLIRITEERLNGIWWNPEYEKDESLFCRLYLIPYFNSLKFDRVIFNHGNREFGKDFLLETTNLFGSKEYYGVQVKAGNLSGSAKIDIQEIVNQIEMCFEIPYKLIDGTEIYVSKTIIVISGDFTENAKERIFRKLDRYQFANTIFIGKHELRAVQIKV